MKIAVASKGDPTSVKTWSGIPPFMIQALEKLGHVIIPITLQAPKQPWYFDWYRRLNQRLLKKWFLADVDPFVLKNIGVQFDTAVNSVNPDVVLSIHGDILAYTTFTAPSVIIHDSTFASLVDYYPENSQLTRRSLRAGNEMYQRALDKADASVFSADWASQSAIHDYNAKPGTVYTIPLGANFSSIPTRKEVEGWISTRLKSSECSFLFLGVNWIRKGGPDAIRFIKALQKLGIPAKLIVAGCKADIEAEDEIFVEQVGFLRKTVPEEEAHLKELLQRCHALLLPSLAECYGCVYCEANAYGLPDIGRDTGGVSEIIKDEFNGLLLKRNETPEELAKRWAAVWLDNSKYEMMSLNARSEYDSRLSYDVFAKKLTSILQQILDKQETINE